MGGHRHGPGPEHDFEPVPGLPQRLPAGEQLLWQGAPDTRALALRAFHARKVAVYFAAVGAVQFATALADGDSVRDALAGLSVLAALAATAVGLLVLIAHLSARSTLYTITDRRVVMRIGIVLTVTFNLPFARIVSADVRRHADGTVDLPLALHADDAIGWAHLWPHARPWRVRRPEPMLRGVPDGERVAVLLAQAWAAATGGTARAAADAATGPRPAGAVSPHVGTVSPHVGPAMPHVGSAMPHVGSASPAAAAGLAPGGRLALDGAVAS